MSFNICFDNNSALKTGSKKQNITINVIQTVAQTEPIETVFNSVKKQRTTKKTIPKIVKERVWNTYFGSDVAKHVCYCCKMNEITTFNFVCGHVQSEHCGGSPDVDNLRPICSICNGSMGTMNMHDFMNKYGFFEPSKTTKTKNTDTNSDIESMVEPAKKITKTKKVVLDRDIDCDTESINEKKIKKTKKLVLDRDIDCDTESINGKKITKTKMIKTIVREITTSSSEYCSETLLGTESIDTKSKNTSKRFSLCNLIVQQISKERKGETSDIILSNLYSPYYETNNKTNILVIASNVSKDLYKPENQTILDLFVNKIIKNLPENKRPLNI